MKYYVGIDLGGTNIVAGVVNENYEVVVKESVKTNSSRGADAVIADMILAAKKVMDKAGINKDDIDWVGVGAPGSANKATGVIEYSNNLEWHYVPLAQKMEEGLGIKVLIANDANAAAYGEFMAGAGKDINSLVMITLGTGVGGGVIIDGRILTGSNYAGGELGHSVIVANGRPCTCGRKGCLEAYTSATGLIHMTQEAMERDKDSVMWEIANGDLKNVNGRTSFDGMRAGDKTAAEVVDLYIEYLGIGIANFINIFQPEILCIGGGISKEGDTLIKPLTKQVNEQNYVHDEKTQTKIMPAKLFNDAGLIGAALLGLEK